MRGWYRLMGAKIGKDAEISTNLSGRYDLVEIGEKCFIADEVVLGDEEIHRGWMRLKRVKTGARVFVGNDAVVPIGSEIPDGALIGIKSKPPANEAMSPGDTWFGTPPIKLPVRQRFDGGGANWTYEAPRWKKFARALFEAVHISLPTMLFVVFGTWSVEWLGPKVLDGQYAQVAALFVFLSVGISVVMTAIVVAIKWATMGRYEPTTQPMWSWWAMRTEAVAVMYWGLAGRVLLDHLRATPFLPWVLRLFGSKFGRGVYMDMTDITEFDCVTVGNFVSINALSALQTHLYEDRVMKVGRIAIGDGVTIGAGSTVLYDTHVGDFARLGPLTLVMKGESIPPDSEWVGAPAEPKGAEDVAAQGRGASKRIRPEPPLLVDTSASSDAAETFAAARSHVAQHLRTSLSRHDLRRKPWPGARLRGRRMPAGHSAERGRRPAGPRPAPTGPVAVHHPAAGARQGQDPVRHLRGGARAGSADHRHADRAADREHRPALEGLCRDPGQVPPRPCRFHL